jgi:N-acetylglucosamine-6-sulfatase
MSNLFIDPSSALPSNGSVNGYPITKIVQRLDALMMVLKTCKQSSCTNPWGVIHPTGNVKCLQDALNVKYDQFYADNYALNPVSFSKCEPGLILSAEGNMMAPIYHEYRAFFD